MALKIYYSQRRECLYLYVVVVMVVSGTCEVEMEGVLCYLLRLPSKAWNKKYDGSITVRLHV